MTRSLVLALGLAAVACRPADQPARGQGSGSAAAQPGSAAADGSAAPANPVQREMRLLTATLQHAVAAIGARDVRPIEHELHQLDAAKEATEAALHDGSYKLPKSPDQLPAFQALDEAFHHDLEELAEASHANDVARAADALGKVLRGCEGCHATFRP